MATATATAPRLKQRYQAEIREALKAELGLTNPMQVPKVEKIVINMGVGEAVNDRKYIDAAINDLTTISGQKPVVVRSRKSIATFKLREGMAIGVKEIGRAHV